MDPKHASTYLNDHLAGSAGALELMEHLERGHEGTPIAELATWLRSEVTEDRELLEAVMERLGIAQSAVRKATAWVSEKVIDVKLKLDDAVDGPLRLLETLEALSLGIEGKRLLARSLGAGAETNSALRDFDFARLERRAEDQRRRVEDARLEAARAILGPPAEAR